MTEVKSYSLSGIRLDGLDHRSLLEIVEDAKRTGTRAVLFNHNLHSLYLYERNKEFRASYEKATAVYVDGMPVIWLAQMAGLPMTSRNRITLLDSFEEMLQASAEREWRVFYLGGEAAIMSRGLSILKERFPTLSIAGRDGFFTDNEAVIAEINAFRPDLLFVGMGMPLQEIWIAKFIAKLQVSAVIPCGATLGYVTGDNYQPPAWAGKLGLYGIFRLFSDPRRLAGRYLIEPLYLLWRYGPRLLAARRRRHTLA
jgi:N-acetylglucosaminyldiphosphoundecaprenol N-acetyl-beta-D-mannosaminyltransferase